MVVELGQGQGHVQNQLINMVETDALDQHLVQGSVSNNPVQVSFKTITSPESHKEFYQS